MNLNFKRKQPEKSFFSMPDKNSLKGTMSSALRTFHFLILGLPLLVYPGVLFANIMALASIGTFSLDSSGTEWIMAILMIGFLLLSTCYPCVYIIRIKRFLQANDKQGKSKQIKMLYLYLIITYISFWLAGVIESWSIL